jgi:L-2-hydroxyglutarate oxidase LhgO
MDCVTSRASAGAARFPAQARLCVEGKHMLYDFCRTYGIPHKNVTKLIVATSDE